MDKVTYSTPLSRSTMAYVLAGGRGTRLMELTETRAKPAVYFGGKSRIVDFALSNALNSGIRRLAVATQYKAHSLIRHLQRGWNFLQPTRNESFDILPASQRIAEGQWYAGTADAVYQNIDVIDSYAPEYLVILAGDHIYKQDYERMLVQHVNDGADVTVACIEVPVAEASGFGVMHVDANDRIVSFVEKPEHPPEMPDRPGWALASMGVYAFNRELLNEQLQRDADDPELVTRLRPRRHPMARHQRQSGCAPLFALLRAIAGRRRSLLARCRDDRCVLASQYRLDGYRARPRSLRP
jgi:glucose-1-phosphate adenylyltransferase